MTSISYDPVSALPEDNLGDILTIRYTRDSLHLADDAFKRLALFLKRRDVPQPHKVQAWNYFHGRFGSKAAVLVGDEYIKWMSDNYPSDSCGND